MPKVIKLEKKEMWDEVKEEFIYQDEIEFEIEHSLYSIEKWEEKYHKPFMVDGNKSGEELIDYIRMMTLTDVDPRIFNYLTPDAINEINAYMNDPHTATTFTKEQEEEFKSKNGNFVTAELVYYWMTAENIPFECRFWNINKLLTLIKVCSIKNKPNDKKDKKLSSASLQARRAEMEARRAKYHTNG